MPSKEKDNRRVDLTYDAISTSLSSGRIKPGEWLRQVSIADELKVSQATVRDALNQLVIEGLAERIPRKGVRVPYVSPGDLQDIYEMRMMAEGLAWQAAAERITVDELKHMQALLPHTGTKSDPRSIEIARQKNLEFHMIAIRASGRWILIRLLSQLLNLNNLRYLLAASSEEVRVRDGRVNVQEHEELVSALHDRRADLSRKLIVKHIQRSMSDRLALFGRQNHPELKILADRNDQ
jgi:DNA-binding GntR family transcriptional regulator